MVWVSQADVSTDGSADAVVGRTARADLSIDLDPTDQKANRALDWYLKALTAAFEADHFIFLWIATEILAGDSDLKVSEPYRGPECGHVISHCPHCNAATTKPVQGASMRRFLTEGFGVDEDIASRLWTARQMLHGRHDFDSKVMSARAVATSPRSRRGCAQAQARHSRRRATIRGAHRDLDLAHRRP